MNARTLAHKHDLPLALVMRSLTAIKQARLLGRNKQADQIQNMITNLVLLNCSIEFINAFFVSLDRINQN